MLHVLNYNLLNSFPINFRHFNPLLCSPQREMNMGDLALCMHYWNIIIFLQRPDIIWLFDTAAKKNA